MDASTLALPLAERAPEVGELLAQIKEIETPDGGWPAADVVGILCEWFTGHGYDIDAAPETDNGRQYEGHVQDDLSGVRSVQCAEGRHGECFDTTTPYDEAREGAGPLGGYYCECMGCEHGPS